jgi:hypothetical protein
MTTGSPPQRPFSRQIYIDGEALVGARWWQESLRQTADPISRRRAIQALAVLGGSAAVLGLIAAFSGSDDHVDISMDALELQKREGWNVGQPGAALRFPTSAGVDADGSRGWVARLPALAAELAPAQSSLAPYYVPTLFQSLEAPSGASLRSALLPMAPGAGNRGFLQGQAILSLFKAVQMPGDTALILDLDGPSSVAVAAGLAEGFDPVFVFDNWPHPLGVVPAHLTLGAAVYQRPVFLRARAARPPGAPPAFVLDRNRLAPYTDEDTQFDNRYVAKLPTAENLRSLGVKHLLYVTPSKSDLRELDDLNDDFVELARASIDVKVLPLTDLEPAPAAQAGTAPAASPGYYYGGHPHTHLWFWTSYGWHTPRTVTRLPQAAPSPALPPSRPLDVSRGAGYKPTPRPTLFSSRTLGGGSGVGKQKPSGFGRVSVRASKSTGTITAVRTGRSGSFGRAGGWSSS